MTRWVACAAAALAIFAPRPVSAVDFELHLGGGSVLPWGAPSEVGNTFGFGALVHLDTVAVGVAGAVAFPDSRTQGRFGAVWIEGRWHPFVLAGLLRPYAVAGVGVVTEDSFSPARVDFSVPRWVTDGPGPVGIVGIGLRYGRTAGAYAAFDVRALNHTHGALSLTAGYVF